MHEYTRESLAASADWTTLGGALPCRLLAVRLLADVLHYRSVCSQQCVGCGTTDFSCLGGAEQCGSCWNFSTTVAHGRAWPLNHKQPAVVECVQQFVGGDTTDSGCHGLLVETPSRLPRGADGAALAGLSATVARMEVRGPRAQAK